MRSSVYTRQFEKDLKRVRKRGKNTDKLKMIVRTILSETPLDPIANRRLNPNSSSSKGTSC